MNSVDYLYKGLCGLARAHQANCMAGHLGAALVAGSFLGEDLPDLDPRVRACIEREMDRVAGGAESVWFDPGKAGFGVPELLAAFPEECPREHRIGEIGEALCANIGSLRQSGHNVIFAALALRGLRKHPEYATDAIIDGVCRLIGGFDNAGPGKGYYGEGRGWLGGDEAALSADAGVPSYESAEAMAGAVIDELICSASQHRRGFGGLFHVINHAAALADLSRIGYGELARQGLSAHRQHLRLWQGLPNLESELGRLVRTEHDPRTPQYWRRTESIQWAGWLTHRLKTLYGFFRLVRLLSDPAPVAQAEQQFLYLMA